MAIEKALYTAHATAIGGRTGSGKTDDGALEVKLDTPSALGGAGGKGTNPEQLFALGYAACFIGAMKAVAARNKTPLAADPVIQSAVAIGPHANKPGAFGIAVDMTIDVPGMDRTALGKLVAEAHEVCPYSNATRGNVDVKLAVAG